MTTMNLYRIVLDKCVRYVVAAHDEDEAMETLRLLEEQAGCLGEFEKASKTIALIPSEEAVSRFFDDEEAKRSWAEELAMHTEPTVIACSEWP